MAALLTACAPTAAQLTRAGQWSMLARRSCVAPPACVAQEACSAAAQVLVADGSRRADVASVAAACQGPAIAPPPAGLVERVAAMTVPIFGLDDALGAVATAAGAAIKAASDRATELQQLRRRLAEQIAKDLAWERGESPRSGAR